MRSWNFGSIACYLTDMLSSQFTNEELKQNSKITEVRLENMFAIYQWGVETKIFRNLSKNLRPVRNLPMRSWNLYNAFFYENS